MIYNAAYLLVAFLAAYPVLIYFVKCRAVYFKDRKLLFESLTYFLFFVFSSAYAYSHAVGFHIPFLINIFYPLFLFCLIQNELEYKIKRDRVSLLLVFLFSNIFLQMVMEIPSKSFYGIELWILLANFFSIFTVFKLDREYADTAYIPKFSVRALIYLSVPCMLTDIYFFNIIFVAQMFYMHLKKRTSELKEPQKIMKSMSDELKKFQDMVEKFSTSIKDFTDKNSLSRYLTTLGNFLEAKGSAIYEWSEERNRFECVEVLGLYFPSQVSNEKLFNNPEVLREITMKQHITNQNSIIWKCGHNSDGNGIFFNYSVKNNDIDLANITQEVRTMILLPLLQETELMGVLVLQNKTDNGYFSESDFRIAKNFAYLAAIILNTSRMMEQKNENMRMSAELTAGNIVQEALFSQKIPKTNGVKVSAFTQPAKEIGGDYYDFITNGDKLGIVIGDVSGKGVAAGILVAILQTYLQNKYEYKEDLKSFIIDLNSYLMQKINIGMFITMLFFEWDSTERRLRYVSCGHEHILHYHAKNKALECIRSGGLAVMMDDDISPYIEERELKIESGDFIVLYTDGVIETFNAAREAYGLEHFVEFVRKNSPIDSSNFSKSLLETLSKWRGDTEQTDDITYLLMEF